MVRMYLLLISKAKKSLVETVSFDPSGWGEVGEVEKLHHFNLYLDDLEHSSNSRHREEDIRGEVLMSVLHHQVPGQRSLVLDPNTGDQAQVVADLREDRLAFS